MVPSVAGLFWSRRKQLAYCFEQWFIGREGTMTFAQSGVVLEQNKQAAVNGACCVAGSRALMSIANVTAPLLCMRLFERNMLFFTPLKGILFTGRYFFCHWWFVEFSIIASCLLTPVAMGLISPIGTVKADVPTYPSKEESEEDSEGNEEEVTPTYVKEDVYYFRGYFSLYYIHVQWFYNHQ